MESLKCSISTGGWSSAVPNFKAQCIRLTLLMKSPVRSTALWNDTLLTRHSVSLWIAPYHQAFSLYQAPGSKPAAFSKGSLTAEDGPALLLNLRSPRREPKHHTPFPAARKAPSLQTTQKNILFQALCCWQYCSVELHGCHCDTYV